MFFRPWSNKELESQQLSYSSGGIYLKSHQLRSLRRVYQIKFRPGASYHLPMKDNKESWGPEKNQSSSKIASSVGPSKIAEFIFFILKRR